MNKEGQIIIPAPGEIFEITVDKGVDESRQDGGPWGFFHSEVNSKKHPRTSQEARVVRACFLDGVDLKPRRGLVYRDVAEQELEVGQKRFVSGDEAMAVIARFKNLGFKTTPVVAFIKSFGFAFFVGRSGSRRSLYQDSSEYWYDCYLFLAVCE